MQRLPPLQPFGVRRTLKRHAAAWTPASLTGVKAWWDYTREVYSDAGTTPAAIDAGVYDWLDVINGYRARQTTSGDRGILKSNGILYDGTSDFHLTDLVTIDCSVGLTVFCRFFPTTLTGDHVMVGKWGGGSTDRHFEISHHDSLGGSFITSDGAFPNNVRISSGSGVQPTQDAWNTLTARFDNAANTMRLEMNGAEVATGTFNLTPTGDNAVTIGTFTAASWFFAGRISDVIICEAAISDDEKTATNSYFA